MGDGRPYDMCRQSVTVCVLYTEGIKPRHPLFNRYGNNRGRVCNIYLIINNIKIKTIWKKQNRLYSDSTNWS